MKRKPFTPEEDQKVQELNQQGLPKKEIARILGRPERSIFSRIRILRKREHQGWGEKEHDPIYQQIIQRQKKAGFLKVGSEGK
jgi:DNA invertase Pin-like site-specific DNA recombinase